MKLFRLSLPDKLKNHWTIARLAFPIILANASVPLLGLADTAAIGQTGGAQELGAIALGALVFSFVYWGFGFLRMGTTGFIAQAAGANDSVEVRVILLRALALGVGIGVLLIGLQEAISWFSLWLMSASEGVKEYVSDYFYIRIWGAPATLSTFALLGTLIGLGHTTRLLITQLFLNGLNICLNLFFVLGLGWGVKGIALGTVISEWLAFGLALWLVVRSLKGMSSSVPFYWPWQQVFIKSKFTAMIRTNSDIMIRTLALLSGFAWFADQGAKFGDITLAANHILLQFISLSAFFLDGYAYVVEMLTGQAFGAKDKNRFIRAIRDSSQLAGVTALLLALMVWTGGSGAIDFLTQDEAVRTVAKQYLPYAAIYVAISFLAFQLDGVFIGATRSKEMRNTGIISLVLFIGIGLLLVAWGNNNGLWLAFIAYVLVRGMSLAAYLPRLLSSLDHKARGNNAKQQTG